jgi:hypothetical protein
MLRYAFIRFDKVILCGSILPRDFPWNQLIDRGQIQAVRNEFGVRDPWVRRVRGYVRNTGCSGAVGFSNTHTRLYQRDFDYDHGEYFGRDHMLDTWVPFLELSLPAIARTESARPVRPPSHVPWGIYVALTSSAALIAVAILVFLSYGVLSKTSFILILSWTALLFGINWCCFKYYSR